MSKEIDYAHPTTEDQWTDGQRCGITMRDYFAAAALPSIIAKDDGTTEWYDQDGGKRTLEKGFVMKGDKFTRLETAAERCACEAYEIADAMIAARKEGA